MNSINKMIRIADMLDQRHSELAGKIDQILRLASTQPDEFEQIVRFIHRLQKKGVTKEKIAKMFVGTPVDPQTVMFAWVAASMLDQPVPEEWIHKE